MRRSSFYGSGVGLQPPTRRNHIAPPAPSLSTRCRQKDSSSDTDRRDTSSSRSSALSRPKYRRPSRPAVTPAPGEEKPFARTTTSTPSPPSTPPIATASRPPYTPNYASERRPAYTTSYSFSPSRYRNPIKNTTPTDNFNGNRPAGCGSGSQSRGSNVLGRPSNNNVSSSYRAPPVRRWMNDLAKQLKEVLDKNYDYINSGEIDSEISKKILSLMPEATSVADRQEAVALKAASRGFRVSYRNGASSSASASAAADIERKQMEISVEEKDEVVVASEEVERLTDIASDSEEEEEEDVEVAPSIYDAELAAILSHYQTRRVPPALEKAIDDHGGDGGGKMEEISDDDDDDAEFASERKSDLSKNTDKEQEDTPSFVPNAAATTSNSSTNWRPKIGEGSLMLLVRLIADSSTPQAALQLYNILDAAVYPTRTPRFLGSMVGLLVKKNCPEEAAALLREAILADKRTTATIGSAPSPSSSSSSSISSRYSTNMTSTTGKYSGTGTGKFGDAWASLSRSGRPEIVQDLIEDLVRAGIPADSDTYMCSIRAYARARDTPAAIACFEEMRRQGIERTSSVFAALARAAADSGNVQLAMKVLYWAERDSETNPTMKLTSVWRELLVLSCNDDAAPGLVRKKERKNDFINVFICFHLIIRVL
jgi:pentatricopeptide repeat protein